MKKILLVLAAVISMQVANAQQQVKSIAAAKASVEAAQKAADDAKKATKVNTWMKLGSTLMDAYYAPQGNAWIGASAQDLMLVMGNEKPSSEEAVVISGQQFTKQVYDTRNYYFNQNGQLQMIEVTAPVVENALDKALAAYTKAYEVDAKHSKAKDIAEAVKNIGQKYTDEAYNAYTFGNYAKASEFFQKAAEASSAVPGIQVDTNAIYNAAFTAYMVGDYDRAKTWFEKSIGAGYDGENGEAYAKLADIAEKAGDIEKSKGILEKAFIVFKLGSYSRNLRNELKKSRKVFFWDCGIRNYVLGDWRPIAQRGTDEAGHLWENWFISERRKRLLSDKPETRMFFWRTAQRQEVDLVEESASGLKAFEVKWNPAKAGGSICQTFRNAYPRAECIGVSPLNCPEHLLRTV